MKNSIYFLILLPLIVFGKRSTSYGISVSNTIATSFAKSTPTSITGTTSICKGSGTVLTAIGASLGSGDTYQWGTGSTIGANIINGQNAVTLAISPTTTTTYWVRVRKLDGGVTSGVYVTVLVNTLEEDQTAYGNGNWIGYVYPNFTNSASPPADVFSTPYRGNITPSGINFDQDLGYNSISGANLCGAYSDNFAIRYKTTINLTPGYYNFSVGADDGYKLKVINDGINSFELGDDNEANVILSNWNDHVYSSSSKTIYLAGSTKLILEYYERTGTSRLSFSYSPCNNPSIAPSSIAGTTSICNGSSTTLSAVGARLSSGAVYQWGTGTTIGTNIIPGQSGASITVAPSAAITTYWVRVLDAAPCGNASLGVSTVVTLVNPSSAPTSITGDTTVCLGSSTTLTVSGGYGSLGSTYQWGTGTLVGSNIIAGQTSSSLTVSPTISTNYWVRRVDNTVCTSSTDGISILVNVNIPDGDQTTYGNDSWIGYVYSNHKTTTNPVVEDLFATNYRGYLTQNEKFDLNLPACIISGVNICGTYNVKYAVRFKMTKNFTAGYYSFLIGGDDGVRLSIDGGATYLIDKWNVQAYSTGTATVYLSGNTNLVLEYFQGPLSNARVTFNYTTCSVSSAPITITGNTTTCSGSPTVLTAAGGFEGVGSTYQWGTGAVVGSNIIVGQTSSSITVSPTNTTIYWVRRIDATPCSLMTSGITTTVTTTTTSTRPTWFSGTNSVCLGYGTTITANGGIAAPGSTYQWGTGSVIGSNIIIGESAQSISVMPVASTIYWVRRLDSGICSTYTDGISTLVTVETPPGNPAIFGDNQWNVYGYSTGDIMLTNPIYAGFYTLKTLNFDTQAGINSWSSFASPSSATEWTGCPVPTDNFTFTLKRKGFSIGNYTLKLLHWDDQASVFINGIQVWSSSTWSGNSSATSAGVLIGTYNLDANSTIEVRVRDLTSNSSVSLDFTKNNTFVTSSSPTSITGNTIICNGTNTVLTATGGTMSSTGSYQWGTGSKIGSNIITGQTAASITVTPKSDTVYWVRRVDSDRNIITGGVTQVVSVIMSPVGGSTSAKQDVCAGTSVSDIVLTGNVGNVVKWQKSNDATFTTFTDIASTSTRLLSSTIGLLYAETYYRAVVSNGSCSTAYSSVSRIVVAPLSVGGTINGSARICSGSNTTLILSSRVGSIIKWQSSTTSDFSSNVSDISNTTQSLTTPSLTTTTYFRAVVQSGACSSVYSSIGIVTVAPVAVGGGIIVSKSDNGTTAKSTVLTLTGFTGNVMKWQSSTTSDFSGNIMDIICNSFTLVVSKAATTTYYRALVQSGTCSSAYSSIGSIEFGDVSVRDSQCGTTLLNLDSSIYPNPVVGAQAYKYRVTNGSDVRVFEPTSRLFNLTQLPGGANYNTTYSVQIAVKINDVWSAFGSSCEITTPSPITKVKAQFCGTTLATIITSIYADALLGVKGYRFEVTDETNVRTFDAPSNLFNLTQLTDGAAYGTTYSIRVAVNVNGVWGAYGASCNVTTPANRIAKQSAKQSAKPVNEVAIVEYAVKAYPNPFSDNFKLLLTSASEETVEVMVYDSLGRIITRKIVKATDVNTVELGNEYTAGVYNVIIGQGNTIKTLRMIKR